MIRSRSREDEAMGEMQYCTHGTQWQTTTLRRLVSGMLLLIVLFLGNTAALSADDTLPPELVDFSISPLSMDTDTGPVTISARIEAHDNLSGFGTNNGWIVVEHSSKGNRRAGGGLSITGGTTLDPIFEKSWEAPQFSPHGTYLITILLMDNVGNYVTYSSADLAALGFPSQIEVSPPPAVCGNQLVELEEQCDDGNADSEDGCSSTCQLEPPLAGDRLHCQQTIGSAGQNFLTQLLAAHQVCLNRQLDGTLSLATKCRATSTGDATTDDALTTAKSDLKTSLRGACKGVILEGLGFPGRCEDPNGPPFTLGELQQCIRKSHLKKADEMLGTEFPLP